VLSSDYWRNHLGSRADIVGRRVSIDAHPMTVIGVAAPGFRGIDWGEVPSVWVPTMMKREATPDFDWLVERRGVWPAFTLRVGLRGDARPRFGSRSAHLAGGSCESCSSRAPSWRLRAPCSA
jgi:hypothetical protein